MIKLLLSVILIILICVFVWKVLINEKPGENKKKVKFDESVKQIESFSPSDIQANDKNDNLEKLNKIYSKINPANFYTQNFNTPNFVSNVEDLRKFYAYGLPPNNGITKPIPDEPTNTKVIENFSTSKNNGILKQVVSDPDWLVPAKQPRDGLELQSDYWAYKNEIPMNGGKFGDIVGYENMGDAYSLFYTRNSNDIVEEQEKQLRKSDDLRNGLGVPQKQAFEYNMSWP